MSRVEKCYLLSLVEKPKNLLLIVPLGPNYFKSDLTKVNSAATKLFRLVFGDVVVQYDHAAVFGSRRNFSDNASSGKR